MNLEVELILDKLRPIKEQDFPKIYKGDEYMELLQSLGVSEREWGQLQESFQNYFTLGKNYLKEGELENALKNLEKALLIYPDDLDSLSAISEVYLRYWQQKKELLYYQKADFFSKRCFVLMPDHEASQTRIAILHPKVLVNKSTQNKLLIIIIGGLIVAIGLAIIVYTMMRLDPITNPGNHF